MKVKISTTNAKLGYQIPSISLPPACSCRHDAPCAGLCYGRKGNFTYKTAQEAHMHNYACYIHDKNEYFNDIITFLNDGLISFKYFRWHVVGDILNEEYFLGMIHVAKKCKNVKFLCFTKKFDIVNNFIASEEKIPANLHIIFSAWDKNFEVVNPYNFPVAYVHFRKEEKNPSIPDLAIPCSGECFKCQACWSLKKGQAVVFEQH